VGVVIRLLRRRPVPKLIGATGIGEPPERYPQATAPVAALFDRVRGSDRRVTTDPAFGAGSPFTCELAGYICSAAFTSGHRVVIGVWDDSPLGPMVDVMWAGPDGERVLLVDRDEVGTFISAVYRFDRVERVAMASRWDGRTLRVRAGDLVLALHSGRTWPIPLAALRSHATFRGVEAFVAKRLLGVRTFGTSPTGIFEWYRADGYRRVIEARATLAGEDLGSLCPFRSPTGFGFSEPPLRPSVVRVRPLLVDPGGTLAQVVDGHK